MEALCVFAIVLFVNVSAILQTPTAICSGGMNVSFVFADLRVAVAEAGKAMLRGTLGGWLGA